MSGISGHALVSFASQLLLCVVWRAPAHFEKLHFMTQFTLEGRGLSPKA